jgi:chemotaxis methyl-accepting protein methylase
VRHKFNEKLKIASRLTSLIGIPAQDIINNPYFEKWMIYILKHGHHFKDAIKLLKKDIKDPISQRLVDLSLINKTCFFRHRAQYKAFKVVFKKLFKDRLAINDRSQIGIWVPGCSTGDEAYTIAMILKKEGYDKSGIPIHILATDISKSNIRYAKKAKYYELCEKYGLIDKATPKLIRKHKEYFIKEKNEYEIRADIKRMVKFRIDNLIRSKIKGRFDLISCHSLLTYFRSDIRRKVISFLLKRLKPHGYLLSNHRLFAQVNKIKLFIRINKKAGYAAWRLK